MLRRTARLRRNVSGYPQRCGEPQSCGEMLADIRKVAENRNVADLVTQLSAAAIYGSFMKRAQFWALAPFN